MMWLSKLWQRLSKPTSNEERLRALTDQISVHLHRLDPSFIEQKNTEDVAVGLELIEEALRNLVENPESKDRNVNVSQKKLPTESEPLQLTDMSKDLIELRDWILLVKTQTEETLLASQVYERLGAILSKSGIDAIEETGIVDYKRHQVIATEMTTDSALDEVICETIRPGYCLQNKLFRYQQVKVYFHE